MFTLTRPKVKTRAPEREPFTDNDRDPKAIGLKDLIMGCLLVPGDTLVVRHESWAKDATVTDVFHMGDPIALDDYLFVLKLDDNTIVEWSHDRIYEAADEASLL